MAKAIVKMPEEFLTKLAGLGTKTPKIIEESLKAGAKVKYKDAIMNAIYKGVSRNV